MCYWRHANSLKFSSKLLLLLANIREHWHCLAADSIEPEWLPRKCCAMLFSNWLIISGNRENLPSTVQVALNSHRHNHTQRRLWWKVMPGVHRMFHNAVYALPTTSTTAPLYRAMNKRTRQLWACHQTCNARRMAHVFSLRDTRGLWA